MKIIHGILAALLLTATASAQTIVARGVSITLPVSAADGGTGVANNAAATLTRSGNHALTITTSGTTGITLPTSGTLATTADVGSSILRYSAQTLTAADGIQVLTNLKLGATPGIASNIWLDSTTGAGDKGLFIKTAGGSVSIFSQSVNDKLALSAPAHIALSVEGTSGLIQFGSSGATSLNQTIYIAHNGIADAGATTKNSHVFALTTSRWNGSAAVDNLAKLTASTDTTGNQRVALSTDGTTVGLDLPNGTSALPSIRMDGSGFYRSAANKWRFVDNAEAVYWTVGPGANAFYDGGSITLDCLNKQLISGGSAKLSWLTGGVVFGAGISVARTATATDYTVLTTDYLIGVTSTAAARVVTLPSAITAGVGKQYIIKDESGAAGTNNITVKATAGTLDGVAAATGIPITTNYGASRWYSDGANWCSW